MCIVAVCAVLLLQNLLPLFIAGVFSFVLLVLIGRSIWTPHQGFGLANKVTTARLLLTFGLFFVSAASFSGPLIFIIALAVLIVDGFDGWVARRRNEASDFGEYFDKETDAYFLLTLCLLAYFQQKAGAWIIIPGLLRYLFVVVLVVIKPEIDKEYRSKWARIIYVTMVIALLALFITPAWFYSPILAAGTTGLFLSFAHYFRWLFSSKDKLLVAPAHRTLFKAGMAVLFLNSLLLVPSLIANLETSSFYPIPDPSQHLTTLTWTRGWYDYFLYVFVRRPNQDLFRICADVVLLVTMLVWWSKKKSALGVLFNFLIAAYMGLLLYEVYDSVVFQFFHRHGIVYEDIQYIVNLYYISIDALSLDHLFQLILILTGIVLFTWWLPVLFRAIAKGFSQPGIQKKGLVFSCIFWPIFIGTWFWYGPGDERPTVRSITGKIVYNASESITLARTITAIEQLPVDPIYDEFDQATMIKKPNIYLFMIESYGRVLRDNASLRPTYDSLMYAFQDEFAQAGWNSATRYSSAPVSGGLSWLSMNSVLSGLFMKNRTFYTRYISRINQYPHLVRFLKQQGYYTITLQPPNKARLGLPIENNYNFDKAVYFDDLHYTGKPYSIWVIPDQYSLGYTHKNYLPADNETPYFLFFETATTHAPWTNLPPYLEDWETLNDIRDVPSDSEKKGSFLNMIGNSYKNRFGKDTPEAPALYLASMRYDLTLIRDYVLEQAPDNSLFIILGDHQPPLLPSTSYETPIHVISKDEHLLQHFASYGFDPGMVKNKRSPRALNHAGIYSMLIDVITYDAERASSLPSSRYRPEGVAPSVLTTSD